MKKLESGEKEENRLVVVDASVILKWFVQEKLTDKAIKLRNDYTSGKIVIASPDIIIYEVINALRYKSNFGIDGLKRVALFLEDYNFLLYSILSNRLAERVIEISFKYGVTIYDASYIALAEYLDSVVYTADTKLVEKVSEMNFVTHISDY